MRPRALKVQLKAHVILVALTSHTWVNEFGHSLGGPSGDRPADLYTGWRPCLFSGTINASELEALIVSDHFQHLTQGKLGPRGTWFFTFKVQYKLLSKNNNKKTFKALSWGKNAPAQHGCHFRTNGWGKERRNQRWEIFLALPSILSYIRCGNQNYRQILLNVPLSIKVSLAETTDYTYPSQL